MRTVHRVQSRPCAWAIQLQLRPSVSAPSIASGLAEALPFGRYGCVAQSFPASSISESSFWYLYLGVGLVVLLSRGMAVTTASTAVDKVQSPPASCNCNQRPSGRIRCCHCRTPPKRKRRKLPRKLSFVVGPPQRPLVNSWPDQRDRSVGWPGICVSGIFYLLQESMDHFPLGEIRAKGLQSLCKSF